MQAEGLALAKAVWAEEEAGEGQASAAQALVVMAEDHDCADRMGDCPHRSTPLAKMDSFDTDLR